MRTRLHMSSIESLCNRHSAAVHFSGCRSLRLPTKVLVRGGPDQWEPLPLTQHAGITVALPGRDCDRARPPFAKVFAPASLDLSMVACLQIMTYACYISYKHTGTKAYILHGSRWHHREYYVGRIRQDGLQLFAAVRCVDGRTTKCIEDGESWVWRGRSEWCRPHCHVGLLPDDFRGVMCPHSQAGTCQRKQTGHRCWSHFLVMTWWHGFDRRTLPLTRGGSVPTAHVGGEYRTSQCCLIDFTIDHHYQQ